MIARQLGVSENSLTNCMRVKPSQVMLLRRSNLCIPGGKHCDSEHWFCSRLTSCCWAAGSWRLRRRALKVWFLRFSGQEPLHRKWCCELRSWWPLTHWSVTKWCVYIISSSHCDPFICFKCHSALVPLPVLQVLRESKALMRNTSRSALEQANELECEALKRVWGSSQGTDSILQYLQRRTELC